MSTYRRNWEVILDGESFKVNTKGPDMANAERMAARDGYTLAEGGAVATQQRLAWLGFRRAYPDHRAAKAFGDFVDVLDDINDLDATDDESPDGLDPTLPAASDE
jgi:hypothetical protein